MAYYPFAPQLSARYTLTSPSGVVAVFNDLTNPNNIGSVTEVTGLDSPEVRETADELVQADGGQHGDFWLGRRPITMSGLIYGHLTEIERRIKIDRLMRASMALRGDSLLSWRPSSRQENWVVNPRFGNDLVTWATGTGNYWLASGGAVTRSASGGPADSPTYARVAPANAANQGYEIPVTGPFYAGNTYHASIYVWGNHNVAGGAAQNLNLYFGDRSANSSNSSITAPQSWNRYTLSWTPSTTVTTAYLGIRSTAATTNPWLVTGARVSPDAQTSYFDGATSGYYWQGAPHSSWSGDFIEMYVPVRRQQPPRISGGWNKEFQLLLVSEWATLFSAAQQSVVGSPATAENRGSYPAYPIFRVAGASTNPSIAVTGAGTGSFVTAGLTISSGQHVDFDMMRHTAIRSDGVSMNRYIDFNTITSWPVFNTGSNTATLTGGGTLTSFWRDTWA